MWLAVDTWILPCHVPFLHRAHHEAVPLSQQPSAPRSLCRFSSQAVWLSVIAVSATKINDDEADLFLLCGLLLLLTLRQPGQRRSLFTHGIRSAVVNSDN